MDARTVRVTCPVPNMLSRIAVWGSYWPRNELKVSSSVNSILLITWMLVQSESFSYPVPYVLSLVEFVADQGMHTWNILVLLDSHPPVMWLLAQTEPGDQSSHIWGKSRSGFGIFLIRIWVPGQVKLHHKKERDCYLFHCASGILVSRENSIRNMKLNKALHKHWVS